MNEVRALTIQYGLRLATLSYAHAARIWYHRGLQAPRPPHPDRPRIISDRRVQHGEPCLEGTRIPAWILADMAEAEGWDVPKAADIYQVPERGVREAIRFMEMWGTD